MTTPKHFHLGDILSVTTGRLVSPTKFPGVRKIMEFMVGHPIFNHSLPLYTEQLSTTLLNQHPQLRTVDTFGISEDTWEQWLDRQVALYGETLPVTPI